MGDPFVAGSAFLKEPVGATEGRGEEEEEEKRNQGSLLFLSL